MNVSSTKLPGILIVEPKIFGDKRGFFFESYNQRDMIAAGIDHQWVQDNHSKSAEGTLRGLHYQVNRGQDKLVRVAIGEVFDVVVDVRQDSPTFGQWEGFVLSAENRKMLYVPKGFAHGFCVLSETAEFLYKCSDYWSPQDERGIAWNDPELGIDWPVSAPILSERDTKHPNFKNAEYM
jgi:dTDP-4-dehydrorhamnose 3,5-epimerase